MKTLFPRPLGRLAVLACILCNPFISEATITISSVSVTSSSCANNGTATIHAHSNHSNAVFLYAIVSGPITYPQQNDSVFNSLYPGNYVATVNDINSFDSAQVSFTIGGTYLPPDFNPVEQATFCTGANSGKIFCNPYLSTGLQPYTWQIISPYTGTPQSADSFTNLSPGIYIIKMSDACGLSRTGSVIVDSGGTGMQLYEVPAILFIGCDTAILYQAIYLDNTQKSTLPIKVTAVSNHGTQVNYELPQPEDTTDYPPLYFIADTLYHVNYGDYVKVCLTDTCQVTECLISDTISPFIFTASFFNYEENCIPGQAAGFVYFYTFPDIQVVQDLVPMTVVVTEYGTNTVVDSFTFSDTCYYDCPSVGPLSTNQIYVSKVYDRCGNMYIDTFAWPGPITPSVFINDWFNACLDSTGDAQIYYYGFGSAVDIDILSGPTVSESTDPAFAYHNNISYPQHFNDISLFPYSIENMPAGTYIIKVSDQCENSVTDTFVKMNVSSLNIDYQFVSNCAGLNTLFIRLGENSPGSFNLYGLDPGDSVGQWQLYEDTIVEYAGLNPGTYILNEPYFKIDDAFLNGNANCWLVNDTIVIPPHNDSILKTTEVATCNGIIYVHVDVDSSNGTLPFQFQIISGPETLPLQDSDIFVLNSFGTYVISVSDSCGNTDVRQVTIDTGRFVPVVRNGGLCAGSKVRLWDISSPYYTYIWQGPNNINYTGDTLTINPLIPADTGIYTITKIVDINGCRDTAYGSYHLVYTDTFHQHISICTGDTLYVGIHAYTSSGSFTDTLIGAYGCDSIELTDLNVVQGPSQVSIEPATVPPCHASAVTLTAIGQGGTFLWSPGGETGDTIDVNPQVVTVYTVTLSDSSICSTTASITVYPSTDSAITLTQNKTIICLNDSAIICAPSGFNNYFWNNGGFTQCITTNIEGNYYVTATNNQGCSVTSNSVSVSIYPPTPVTVSVSGGDTLTCYPAQSYQWYLNGTAIPGATGATLVGTATGNYTVLITDNNGCSFYSEPVTITGINDYLNGSEYITVYPNPNYNGAWKVDVSAAFIGSACQVYDEAGRVIYNGILNTGKSTLQLDAASGIYLMRVSTGQKSYNLKLVQF